MRLAKYLATAGVASRRAADEMIRAGRVGIDGAAVTDPARDVTGENDVTVDGTRVNPESQRVVYALNKPVGVVSTARDPQRRPTVVELIDSDVRLYPVGRLDIDTTGLILLTNDGELAHLLMHPSFEVEKTYRASVTNTPVRNGALVALEHGIELDDGRTAPAKVRRVRSDTLEITIHEGRKRQVKRMLEHVGHPVKKLQRTAFGPLKLGDLKPGAHRKLSATEVDVLRAAGTAGRRSGASSSAAHPRARTESARPGGRKPAA